MVITIIGEMKNLRCLREWVVVALSVIPTLAAFDILLPSSSWRCYHLWGLPPCLGNTTCSSTVRRSAFIHTCLEADP